MGNEGSGAGWGFDTSFGRVVRGACAAWSRSKPLSLLISLAPVTALALGCAAAAKVQAALANAPAAQSALAALIATVAVAEAAAATAIGAARALLCLAGDIGRQRCGVLLALAVLAASAGAAAIALTTDSLAATCAALSAFLGLAYLRWGFARLYLADDSPVLRAFEDDVVRLQAMLGAGPSASEAGDEA